MAIRVHIREWNLESTDPDLSTWSDVGNIGKEYDSKWTEEKGNRSFDNLFGSSRIFFSPRFITEQSSYQTSAGYSVHADLSTHEELLSNRSETHAALGDEHAELLM